MIQGNFEVVGSTLVFTASSTISLKSYSTNLPNDVALDPDSSRKLGYSSVVVLAGKYDITKGTTLNYKVKLVK